MLTGFLAKSRVVWNDRLTEETVLFLSFLTAQGAECTLKVCPGFCI